MIRAKLLKELTIIVHTFFHRFIVALTVAIICIVSLSAMVFDNRYFPLIQYPYITKPGRESHITGDFFITTASRADDERDRAIGIAELSGPFDQAQLAYSFELAQLPPPLAPGLIDGELPWMLSGKLQTQGFAWSYQQYLWGGFSAGILGLAMRSNSNINFIFNSAKASSVTPVLSESDIFALDEIRRQMLADLGLSCNHVQQGGLGDTEFYLRWFNRHEYCLKLRSLEYAFRLGGLAPTGVKREINKPASVPFGGNGHWGIYASGDAEFEIKEDWKGGFLLRLSKRFARTREERMPVAHPAQPVPNKPGTFFVPPSEPQIFGVIVGPARVNPGFTAIFSAYAEWEGIRDGLGARLQYTLINHNQDDWTDERVDKTVPVNLEEVKRRSSWASEYFTLTGFYDFNKDTVYCNYKPIVRVAWDIPFTLLVGHRFVHSYKVSLGLEFNF
jgi:hypothetical protein